MVVVQKTKDREIKVHICGICGLPGIVKYSEIDPDTGVLIQKEHKVGCVGHDGIHPSMWNKAVGDTKEIRSLGFDDYKRLRRKKNEIQKASKDD